MIHAMLNASRWSLSLGAKFIRVVPIKTLLIVLLTLVSQMATLLASFLPLKVVILLGSEGIPRYFPASFAQIDRDILIALLSICTLGFFVLYLLAERLIAWTTRLATGQLLAKSHKMVLFENQDDIAATAYQRYSRSLAGGVFIILALLGLSIFYPAMAAVLVGYGVATTLLLWLLHGASSGVRERLENRLVATLNLMGGIGFFVAFGYLVADFILWTPPGVIIAIVSLLLSRQVMQRASGMLGDLAALQKQRVKLDALFFHGKVLMTQQVNPDKTFWPLLQPESRQSWVKPLLDELVGESGEPFESAWQQVGMANVAGLRVCRGNRGYLFKLYETNRSSLAQHEATLMGEPAKGLPSCALLGITQLQKFHCLLYQLPKGSSPEPQEVKALANTLRAKLLAVEPFPALVQRYQRSKPMLWQRLDRALLEKLQVAVTGEVQQAAFELLLVELPRLHGVLKSLPVGLVNPDISQDAIWVAEDGDPILLQWGRWALEPLGAGWPEQPKLLDGLMPAITEAAENRPVLSTLLPQHVELAALAFALERECNRQRFVQALELLPAIHERLVPGERLQSLDQGALHE